MTGERTLVIGTGNEHRGDDAAGLLAARSLRTLIGHRGPAEILEHRGDGAALIELWAGRSWVILVDAVRSAGSPGQVLRFDASDRPLEAEREHGSTHAFGPAGAIEMARCLGRLPRRVEIYGITGSLFSIGAEAQPAVCVAARAVARSIAELIGLTSGWARRSGV
jgi:hydrogenase maturation protease